MIRTLDYLGIYSMMPYSKSISIIEQMLKKVIMKEDFDNTFLK